MLRFEAGTQPFVRVFLARQPVWCSQVAQSYGLLLGTIVMVPKTAQTLAAILMLTFILTGGYFVRGVCVHLFAFIYVWATTTTRTSPTVSGLQFCISGKAG